ncbi:sodium:dicarboxylate symporter family protein [Trinickia symbiotica]|nr:sodium:dicarboxylate symporter family protein [Trinickia symbiotica]
MLFLAQATNTHLALAQEVTLLLVTMLTSKGSTGVTGAGFITLAASLSVVPTVPVSAMVLILGIDRFMSECPALTNIVGNGVASIIVSAWEGGLDRNKLAAALSPADLERGRVDSRSASILEATASDRTAS